ncbi:MAG: DUF86 domain-containing protein [Acidobacteria bacterium]|nr:DUF86 domain-containing protein [Acidobacteriota bacterium]
MRGNRLRLQDIIRAVDEVNKILVGVRRKEFLENRILQSAVMHHIFVIGEASVNVSADLQRRHPKVWWKALRRLRNVVAHEYFAIDYLAVWNVVKKDLPELERQIRTVLDKEFGS